MKFLSRNRFLISASVKRTKKKVNLLISLLIWFVEFLDIIGQSARVNFSLQRKNCHWLMFKLKIKIEHSFEFLVKLLFVELKMFCGEQFNGRCVSKHTHRWRENYTFFCLTSLSFRVSTFIALNSFLYSLQIHAVILVFNFTVILCHLSGIWRQPATNEEKK